MSRDGDVMACESTFIKRFVAERVSGLYNERQMFAGPDKKWKRFEDKWRTLRKNVVCVHIFTAELIRNRGRRKQMRGFLWLNNFKNNVLYMRRGKIGNALWK